MSAKTEKTEENETVPIQVRCEETKPNMCKDCRRDPCVWKEFGDERKGCFGPYGGLLSQV